ncbi:hypothetical protein SAMN04490182_2361 [Pseudomonas cedrina]|uniref:Uncharacterized protein n=1 Tax=Pseudomonas cedrina TaxID=651740 RepID=A0ABY0UJF6_PSECE|nr:hypothetical protein [Pseudomonas cedrina]SDS77656.1 hypothetical protein SAMN04490182_2361 [Pseudomonas cedrina]
MQRLLAMVVLCFTFAATFNTASAQAQAAGYPAPAPSSSESRPSVEWRNVRTQFVATDALAADAFSRNINWSVQLSFT